MEKIRMRIEVPEPYVRLSIPAWQSSLRDIRRTRRFAVGLSWALAGMTLVAFIGWMR